MSPVLNFPSKKKAKGRRLLSMAISAGVVVLLGALAWLIWFSPVLDVRKVEVSGTALLAPHEVVNAANVPLGTPLARLDYKAITERVRTLPEVAHVDVVARPLHTVQVNIQERTAVFVAESRGKRWLVDAEGHAFREAPQGPALVATVGSEERSLLADVATVVAALPDSLRKDASIDARSSHSITVNLSGGKVVRWGDARDSALKADVAGKLVAAVKAREYDVSSPSRPVTR